MVVKHRSHKGSTTFTSRYCRTLEEIIVLPLGTSYGCYELQFMNANKKKQNFLLVYRTRDHKRNVNAQNRNPHENITQI